MFPFPSTEKVKHHHPPGMKAPNEDLHVISEKKIVLNNLIPHASFLKMNSLISYSE